MIKNEFSYDNWLQIRLIRSKELLNAKIQEHRNGYIKRNVGRSSLYFFDLIKTIQESLISEIKIIFLELPKEELLKSSEIYDIKKNLLHFVEQSYSDALNLNYLIVSPDVIQKNKAESQKTVFNEIEILIHNLLISISDKMIKVEANEHYLIERGDSLTVKEVCTMHNKTPKVFISHSSQDKTFVSCLVDLMEDIGITAEQLFCSSIPGYDIPLNEDIYDFLKVQFQAHDLHVVFVLSENYYQSVASMNEMGAAWVLQNKFTTILLPGFEFKEIKGAINPRQISLKLDSDPTEVREKLGQLKDILTQEFKLPNIPYIRWERKRDAFITAISQPVICEDTISVDALLILKTACVTANGTIMKINSHSGTDIQVGDKNFITTQERREVARWEDCLDELLRKGFIQERGIKGEIFVVTKSGYDYIDYIENIDK